MSLPFKGVKSIYEFNYSLRIMKIRLIICLGVAIFWYSCREITDEKYISEGVIEYSISYPETDENSLFSGLFPDKMIMTFKDGKKSYEMTGGMGLFKTTIISNPEANEIIHMVKVMNKKIAFIYDTNSIKQLSQEFSVETIKNEAVTKNIAGYVSHQAIVKMKDNGTDFNIFYTKDLNIENPNWGTPYNNVEGVLLDYRLKQYNIDMKFTALSVIKEDVSDTIFKLPADYKLVSKEELDEIFLNFN